MESGTPLTEKKKDSSYYDRFTGQLHRPAGKDSGRGCGLRVRARRISRSITFGGDLAAKLAKSWVIL